MPTYQCLTSVLRPRDHMGTVSASQIDVLQSQSEFYKSFSKKSFSTTPICLTPDSGAYSVLLWGEGGVILIEFQISCIFSNSLAELDELCGSPGSPRCPVPGCPNALATGCGQPRCAFEMIRGTPEDPRVFYWIEKK